MGTSLLRIARDLIEELNLERVVDPDTYASDFFSAENRLFDDIGTAYPYRRPVGSMRTRSAIRIGAASDELVVAYAQWRARGFSLLAMQDLFTAFNAQYEGTVAFDDWLDKHAPMMRYERFGALAGQVLYTGETTRLGVTLERVDYSEVLRIIAETKQAGDARKKVDISAAREPIEYATLLDRIRVDMEGFDGEPLGRFAELYVPYVGTGSLVRSE